VGQYGSTPLPGPGNLTASLSWSWQHPSLFIAPGCTLIDDDSNIYFTVVDGIRKFSPDGRVLWHYSNGLSHACPSLMGDYLYGSTIEAHLYAVSLETGRERWSTVAAPGAVEMDTPYVEAHDGLVLAAFEKDASKHGGMAGNTRIVAVRAEDGSLAWTYKSENVLWNFMPIFAEDTFMTMDITGGVYRFGLHNGSEIWHTPPPAEFAESFTDGGCILGPSNDVLYSCSNLQPVMLSNTDSGRGALRAHRVSDGKVIWDQHLPYPCVSWPAVSGDGRSVVVPVGALPFPIPANVIGAALAFQFLALFLAVVLIFRCCPCPCRLPACCLRAWLVLLVLSLAGLPLAHVCSLWLLPRVQLAADIAVLPVRHNEVLAFEPLTGAPQWHYRDIPAWTFLAARGEEEHFLRRFFGGPRSQQRPVCGPASWSAPTFGGDGVAYMGNLNGYLYAINDTNRDGRIGAAEVSSLDLGAASLHAGAAFAPGFMAYSSCDGLYVFKT